MMRYAIAFSMMLVFTWAVYPVIGTVDTRKNEMQLGNFSISLTVKDINASKEFYEKLGFKVSGGDLKHKYVIMQNETSTIGLFQGMFDKNSLTYNPGWDRDKNTLTEFQDVRELQQELKKRGLNPVVSADESSDGPAFFTLVDPTVIPSLSTSTYPSRAKKVGFQPGEDRAFSG